MSICDLCANEMTTGASCVIAALHDDGQAFPLPRHGVRGTAPARGRPCGDCGVAPGGLHHLGCDLQRCPGSGGQLISCGCLWDEFPEREDDWDDPDDDWDDEWEEDDDPLPPAATTSTSGLVLVPFGAAAAPLRARHREPLAELAHWSFAAGRPIDLDHAAVAVHLLRLGAPPSDEPAGPPLLQRPDISDYLWANFFNWCSLHGTLIPDHHAEHAWTVLCWASVTGRLHPDSDPLAALLEPLQCYGGLDAAGRPAPAGEEPAFACQCKLPYNPALPDGVIERIVGIWNDERMIERVRPGMRGAPTMAEMGPLIALAGRLNGEVGRLALDPLEWTFSGRRDPGRNAPALSFFLQSEGPRIGRPLLALDDDGVVHAPVTDRRRKAGYRWVRRPDTVLLGSLPATPTREWRRPQRAS